MSIKTIIAGGRDHIITKHEAERIRVILNDLDTSTILSGMAQGVDTCAAFLAELEGYELEKHPAQWRINGRYDKGAGFKRNVAMAEAGNALIALQGGRGTRHMIQTMRDEGKVIYLLNAKGETWVLPSTEEEDEPKWMEISEDMDKATANKEEITG